MSKKETEIVTVTWEEMNKEGEFNCPKCGISISPDHDEDWKDITGTLPVEPLEILVIEHACGQKIKVDMTGSPALDEENTRE